MLSLRRILVLVHDENRLKFAAFSTAIRTSAMVRALLLGMMGKWCDESS
jgi:hypothetical protein